MSLNSSCWALAARLFRTSLAKSVESYGERELVMHLRRAGLDLDTGFARTEMPWSSLRSIARGRAAWLFHVRTGSRFYVPAAAIPADARALVARWAAAAGVRLS